jgi:hypothetical protein
MPCLPASRAVRRKRMSQGCEHGCYVGGGANNETRGGLGGWLSCVPLLVFQTGNTRRVRDGYMSLSTRGHARARPTRAEGPICRRNVIASARPCTPGPPGNLHGKEGVDPGSRPGVARSRNILLVQRLAFEPPVGRASPSFAEDIERDHQTGDGRGASLQALCVLHPEHARWAFAGLSWS